MTTLPDPLDLIRLRGKVALVTGGTGDIGLRLAQALAGAGARVAVLGRSGPRAATAATEAGEGVFAVAADLTRKAEADRAVADVVAHFGRLDILVNAIGGSGGVDMFAPAEDYPEEKWRHILDLNLSAVLWPSQAAARQMIAQGGGGSIVNLSSVRGQLAMRAGHTAYVAAKGALNMLTRQHASEWAAHAIRVNAIAPTFVRTQSVARLLADKPFHDRIVARIPLGRIAEPDDLVGATLFFCSGASAYVTGQVLALDGGLTACQ